jgi:hypothetical protein
MELVGKKEKRDTDKKLDDSISESYRPCICISRDGYMAKPEASKS